MPGTTAFPAALDTFPAIDPNTQENAPGVEHDVVHENVHAAVAALQAKVGINASTNAASLDARIGKIGRPSLLAQGALSALRVVVAETGQARYPDITASADAAKVVGVTTSGVTDGQPVLVQSDGELLDASWSWSPGIVWCGANGVLTQTLPTGWLMEVGRALASNRLLIDLQTPYLRN